MGAALLITFRETLEAALVIGIVLAFLDRAGLRRLKGAVWVGAAAGILSSLALAFLFIRAFGQFEGRAEQLLEGTVMLAGAILLTTLILWLNKGDVRSSMEARTAASADSRGWLGIALLVFVSVLREGIETVLFIGSTLWNSGLSGGIGALVGVATAATLGCLFFRSGMRISMRGFFATTNVLLVLFAAGLIGRSVGEFNEAGLVPAGVERLWNLARLVDEDGAFGSFLRGLFGYTAAPSLAQVAVYVAYLAAIASIVVGRARRLA